MARRWLINTSNNTLVGTVDDDDVTAIPAGRYAVPESVIRASGAPRSTIRVGGTWVVTGSIGVYTQPAGRTTAQTRDVRRAILARNILKNWLPAANAALAESYPVVSKRLRLQMDAMARVIVQNDTVENHYDAVLAESEVSGYDFVLYAGDAWHTATGGYYDTSGSTPYPDGSWTFHTINQNLAGSPTDGDTNGTSHSGITRFTNELNWMRELWKFANP